MTKEEVSQIANTLTYVWNRTILHFNSEAIMVGYFVSKTPELKDNEWNFVRTPKEQGKEIPTIINGEELYKIDIIEFTELKSYLNR